MTRDPAVERLRPLFDPVWYLSAYGDVAASGADPWTHFVRHGRAEGRLPMRCRALEARSALKAGLTDRATTDLRRILTGDVGIDGAIAAWVLADHHGTNGEWRQALDLIARFRSVEAAAALVDPEAPARLAVQSSLMLGDRPAQPDGLTPAETAYAAMLIALSAGEDPAGPLSRIHAAAGLAPARLLDGDGPAFGRLAFEAQARRRRGPLVSVIVTLNDDSGPLEAALGSLLAQDWTALEILVVDHRTRDDDGILRRMAEGDPRIKPMTPDRPMGAMAARNLALGAATGAYVTLHGTDQVAHPARIRLQIGAMRFRPRIAATRIASLQVAEDLTPAAWRGDGVWLRPDPATVMFRRRLRDRLGYWDQVAAGADADAELDRRIRSAQGAIADVLPQVPLSLRLSGDRPDPDYLEAASRWHAESASPMMPRSPDRRPFVAPTGARPDAQSPKPGPESGPEPTDFDLICASPLWDPAWYLSTNLDVMASGIHPAAHYLSSGGAEGRDPGPLFSSTAHRARLGLPAGRNPLIEAIRTGQATPGPVSLTGEVGRGRPVLVVAHEAGAQVFGAERSFLDMLRRLVARGDRPVTVLPRRTNETYLQDVRHLSGAVEILPQRWRHGTAGPHPQSVGALADLIAHWRAEAVHVNTLTLDAPLAAARGAGVESIVHVREMPPEDPFLCDILGADPEGLRRAILAEADRFVANSPLVVDWLSAPGRVTLEPNEVDEALFELDWSPGPDLTVALIASLIPKKGVGDFVEVARRVQAAGSTARFRLIGPGEVQIAGDRPANLELVGYADGPGQAIAQADVVMSLSKFAESFGRTVLEAMAAGRPVVVYRRGAPVWLVGDGAEAGGLVVPADDVAAAAEAILSLDRDRTVLSALSAAARRRARRLQP